MLAGTKRCYGINKWICFSFADYIEMPIHRGKDKKGPYYQYGSQKKYYYKSGSKRSREAAYKKAHAQKVAILATGWREPHGGGATRAPGWREPHGGGRRKKRR